MNEIHEAKTDKHERKNKNSLSSNPTEDFSALSQSLAEQLENQRRQSTQHTITNNLMQPGPDRYLQSIPINNNIRHILSKGL